ncbi:hypothetical protein EDEG_01567 [Edhazardia aedis USNM 41457]|uniref:Uncharacterized protein n=1 Tax=Edhazardia aedis (strain USNM 41457) TaxID=1003232 RepID=J9D8Q6_EDHAE|nr:hypothetical protein EDEG_01567 [Edhazardia aedis USNM 41457]|eukprot:EJW04131.1 hypothetical protein EDEG_01567 [Edhazardia aedis USNM 41457]
MENEKLVFVCLMIFSVALVLLLLVKIMRSLRVKFKFTPKLTRLIEAGEIIRSKRPEYTEKLIILMDEILIGKEKYERNEDNEHFENEIHAYSSVLLETKNYAWFFYISEILKDFALFLTSEECMERSKQSEIFLTSIFNTLYIDYTKKTNSLTYVFMVFFICFYNHLFKIFWKI